MADGVPARLPDSYIGRQRLLVIAVALTVTAIKLLLAATTSGSNDVGNYHAFANAIRHFGPIDMYGHTVVVGEHVYPVYNHPPLVGWMLVLFNRLSDLGIPFRFLIRLPATIADVVTTVLAFELIRRTRPLREATVAGVIIASSPALIIVSGYHGNTDPIFVMFAFVSLYLLVTDRSALFAGAAYAAAISTKIVPIVALPVLLLIVARSGRRRLLEFLAGSGAVLAPLWVPVIVRSWRPFSQNVLGFKGAPGEWGLVRIASLLGVSGHGLEVLEGPGRYPLLLLSAGIPLLIAWRQPERSTAAFGLSLVGVLLLSTGTSGRYLVWAVAAAFLVDFWSAAVYNLAASVLLVVVYDRWSRAFPWQWNDAHGSAWTPTEILLAEIAWLALLAVALRGLTKRKPPEVLVADGVRCGVPTIARACTNPREDFN